MKNKICVLLMFLLLMSILPIPAAAETIIDLNAKGSLTVRAVYENTPLEGLKLNCIRVGDLIPTADGYYFECIYDDSIFTSENIHNTKNPQKMLELVQKNNGVAISVNADKKGNITFQNLTPGLYLIYQKTPQNLKNMKYEISPFLVTIPFDGKYHVNASSKPGLDLYPEDPTDETTQKPPEKLPQTGQLSWPIPWMASIGMMLFALGWWLCFGFRKDTYET